jgi:hypothetical protein
MTAAITSIYPRYGTVKGGTVISLTGINLQSDTTKYTIALDNKDCDVTFANSTLVLCTTAPRPGSYGDPTISIVYSGYGAIATGSNIFRYVSAWSDPDTWGGEYTPVDGESVYVPAGLHLLVDVDSTPILEAVIVEGSIIFPSDDLNLTHLRTFDAYYVFVNGGYFEAGTEDYPYLSKLIITMHG